MGPGRGSVLEDFNAPPKKQRSSTVGEVPLPPSKQTRLVIIGAGFAGLSAARTIQGAGERVEVIVLEASSCVGGRVRSGTVSSVGAALCCFVSPMWRCDAAPNGLFAAAERHTRRTGCHLVSRHPGEPALRHCGLGGSDSRPEGRPW